VHFRDGSLVEAGVANVANHADHLAWIGPRISHYQPLPEWLGSVVQKLADELLVYNNYWFGGRGVVAVEISPPQDRRGHGRKIAGAHLPAPCRLRLAGAPAGAPFDLHANERVHPAERQPERNGRRLDARQAPCALEHLTDERGPARRVRV